MNENGSSPQPLLKSEVPWARGSDVPSPGPRPKYQCFLRTDWVFSQSTSMYSTHIFEGAGKLEDKP
jgi:hypothetical protein